MTTPYSVTTSKGSVSYDNYVNAPITGPLSTKQTPAQIPYHNYGILVGIRPTPAQFFPSQEPIYSDMNTNARQQYLRSTSSINQVKNLTATNSFFNYSTGNRQSVSAHTNYIAPIQSSMYLNIKKANAIGKSAYKVGLPINAPITTKNYMPSSTRSSIRRARSSGSCAPEKKGAIPNYSLVNNDRGAGWGSIVRSTY